MPLDSPLPPLPAITAEQGLATLEAFRINILPSFGFLTPSRVQDLFNRYVTTPQTIGSDQIALLYSCLALGRLRMLSVQWESESWTVGWDAEGRHFVVLSCYQAPESVEERVVHCAA
jgi:hypothetical protein